MRKQETLAVKHEGESKTCGFTFKTIFFVFRRLRKFYHVLKVNSTLTSPRTSPLIKTGNDCHLTINVLPKLSVGGLHDFRNFAKNFLSSFDSHLSQFLHDCRILFPLLFKYPPMNKIRPQTTRDPMDQSVAIIKDNVSTSARRQMRVEIENMGKPVNMVWRGTRNFPATRLNIVCNICTALNSLIRYVGSRRRGIE